MNKDDLEKLWSDPKNYKWGALYCCKEDPRVVVPKRPKWAGWTVNFAHASAWLVIIELLLIVLVPFFFGLLIWPATEWGAVYGTVVGILAMIFFCVRLSSVE